MWVTACSGLMLTTVLVATAYALVDQHPIHHLESLALLVNSGGSRVCHSSACLDPNRAVELARSPAYSHCSGSDCDIESAPAEEPARSVPDTFRHSRLQ